MVNVRQAHVVKMPEVIWTDSFEALLVALALDLGRAVASLLHHAARSLHRDLDPTATQLVSDLARPEAGVMVPLAEDLLVALALDLRGVWSGSG